MADTTTLVNRLVEALNGRDFAGLAALADEDVAIDGIAGTDNGREALRDRFARHFQAFDESYGDALVMRDEAGRNVCVRLTVRGGGASGGGSSSRERILLLEIEDGLVTRLAFFGPQER